ncbi:site-specific integrase [Leptolyngbya sp. AN02str]|uniref:site-specific integrase n=1 Tax=Leptolyngbya sp. AN02str TaxID=3423363 RepID=UPI003D310475
MSDVSALDPKLEQVNQRLKAARMGLQIERRGSKLNLRGTLPPRPGSHRLRPHQQRLRLDLPATAAGLKQAEQEVKVIAAKLIQKTFDWRDYLDISGGGRLIQMDLPQKVQAFQEHMLAHPKRGSNPGSVRTTWDKAYAPYLNKLLHIAGDRPNLSLPEAIYLTVQDTAAHTRSRQVCCTAMSAFAQFLHLDLPIDLKTYWGDYGTAKTQKRDLPTDDEILNFCDRIPNPAWRFVYGVMATYGLRNHEVFFCDYTALKTGDPKGVIEVLETTKTGSHQVWPFYPDWVERFQLRDVNLPPLNTDLTETTLQRIGQLVSTQFRRYNLPISPYDLRHAWAVRTIHLGIPDTVAAKMMGHSVAIHTRTYHRWITGRDQQLAVDAAMMRLSNRSSALQSE